MKIVSIDLKNFKMFQNVSVAEIPPFCVVVGANGTGKFTLFGIFGFKKNKDILRYIGRKMIRS